MGKYLRKQAMYSTCLWLLEKINAMPNIDQKPTEDERIRKGLIKGLSAMRDIHHHQTFSDDAININEALAWLEMQGVKKQEWSEEDERNMNQTLYFMQGGGLIQGKKDILLDWLKSLKDRMKGKEE